MSTVNTSTPESQNPPLHPAVHVDVELLDKFRNWFRLHESFFEIDGRFGKQKTKISTIDNLLAYSLGYQNHYGNLVAACRSDSFVFDPQLVDLRSVAKKYVSLSELPDNLCIFLTMYGKLMGEGPQLDEIMRELLLHCVISRTYQFLKHDWQFQEYALNHLFKEDNEKALYGIVGCSIPLCLDTSSLLGKLVWPDFGLENYREAIEYEYEERFGSFSTLHQHSANQEDYRSQYKEWFSEVSVPNVAVFVLQTLQSEIQKRLINEDDGIFHECLINPSAELNYKAFKGASSEVLLEIRSNYLYQTTSDGLTHRIECPEHIDNRNAAVRYWDQKKHGYLRDLKEGWERSIKLVLKNYVN